MIKKNYESKMGKMRKWLLYNPRSAYPSSIAIRLVNVII